jgi:ABC-type nitrate/sulfonate/bicarbonate transport system substrate-binding protein
MQKLSLALDWTPNINHIGFFIAKEKGFYLDNGIELAIIDPSQDAYKLTPAKKVEEGLADFALCPTESLISYRTKKTPFPLKAIAAILQQDLSAIAVKKQSNIKSPKDLDGKSYASYQAKYEDEIVKQMIISDGGKGDISLVYPNKLGIWDTILRDSYDSTWIFLNWEGVQAETQNLDFRYFLLSDFNIPYSYSPVLVCNEHYITEKHSSYRQFLAATKKGYLFTKENPKESVDILAKFLPQSDKNTDLSKSLSLTAPHFGESNNWGELREKTVDNFLAWLYEKKLEHKSLIATDLYTNELLN